VRLAITIVAPCPVASSCRCSFDSTNKSRSRPAARIWQGVQGVKNCSSGPCLQDQKAPPPPPTVQQQQQQHQCCRQTIAPSTSPSTLPCSTHEHPGCKAGQRPTYSWLIAQAMSSTAWRCTAMMRRRCPTCDRTSLMNSSLLLPACFNCENFASSCCKTSDRPGDQDTCGFRCSSQGRWCSGAAVKAGGAVVQQNIHFSQTHCASNTKGKHKL